MRHHRPDATYGGWRFCDTSGCRVIFYLGREAVDEDEAMRVTIAFLEQHVPAGVSPMCGNSICQDRRFLHRHMPELERYFHYRNLDVSTVKELCRRWAPQVSESHSKSGAHRALQDIHESIDELRHYRAHFLRPAPAPGGAQDR